MFDYRAYLINLVDENKISQELLISGLMNSPRKRRGIRQGIDFFLLGKPRGIRPDGGIKTIGLELTHLVMSYSTWVEETQDKADFAGKLATDPDFRIQCMDAINQERLETRIRALLIYNQKLINVSFTNAPFLCIVTNGAT